MEDQRSLMVEINETVEMDGLKMDKNVEVDGGEDISGRWTESWWGR